MYWLLYCVCYVYNIYTVYMQSLYSIVYSLYMGHYQKSVEFLSWKLMAQ
jgi:hypothetical protein